MFGVNILKGKRPYSMSRLKEVGNLLLCGHWKTKYKLFACHLKGNSFATFISLMPHRSLCTYCVPSWPIQFLPRIVQVPTFITMPHRSLCTYCVPYIFSIRLAQWLRAKRWREGSYECMDGYILVLLLRITAQCSGTVVMESPSYSQVNHEFLK